MNRTTLSFARCTAMAALAVLIQGCAWLSPGLQEPEPQQPSFRQSSNTAPADLQLLCASEAASTYGVASERVLPVSSSAEGETYKVVLNADGSEVECTIDNDGTVLSLVRA